MYHWYLKKKTRELFDRLADDDYEALLALATPDITHTFAGDTPFGGTRRGVPALRRWFEHLFALLTRRKFQVNSVVVKGGPWRTQVAVEWSGVFHTADGQTYNNQGTDVMELRWGRLVGVRVYHDTATVAAVFTRLASSGYSDASPPVSY